MTESTHTEAAAIPTPFPTLRTGRRTASRLAEDRTDPPSIRPIASFSQVRQVCSRHGIQFNVWVCTLHRRLPLASRADPAEPRCGCTARAGSRGVRAPFHTGRADRPHTTCGWRVRGMREGRVSSRTPVAVAEPIRTHLLGSLGSLGGLLATLRGGSALRLLGLANGGLLGEA